MIKSLKECLGLDKKALEESRINNFCTNAREYAEEGIRSHKRAKREKESLLEQKLDLGPRNTVSLAAELQKTDYKKLIDEVFELKKDIKELEITIECEEELFNQLFPTESEGK